MTSRDFFYKVGPVETNIPWFRPDPQNLENWKNDLYNSFDDFGPYKIWLLGSAIEDRASWDADFTITGKLEDKQLLQDLIISMYKLGFKNRLLVDVRWCDDLYKYLNLGKYCKKLQVACEETVSFGACSGYRCLDPRSIKSDYIVIANKVIKNKKVITDLKSAKKIHEHLWLVEGEGPTSKPYYSEKHRILMRNTAQNNTYPILMSENVNFFNYIEWP